MCIRPQRPCRPPSPPSRWGLESLGGKSRFSRVNRESAVVLGVVPGPSSPSIRLPHPGQGMLGPHQTGALGQERWGGEQRGGEGRGVLSRVRASQTNWKVVTRLVDSLKASWLGWPTPGDGPGAPGHPGTGTAVQAQRLGDTRDAGGRPSCAPSLGGTRSHLFYSWLLDSVVPGSAFSPHRKAHK